MGWKTYLIVVDDIVSEDTILNALSRSDYELDVKLTGEDLFPSEGFSISSYNGCTIIGDPDLVMNIMDEYQDPQALARVSELGGARVVACVLHSVVNLAAFTLFQNGEVARAYVCASDEGVVVDEGDMLECEKRVYSAYETKTLEDGTKLFTDAEDEYDQSSLGEDVLSLIHI